MGIPIGTVMSSLSRARQALRGALDSELKRRAAVPPTHRRNKRRVPWRISGCVEKIRLLRFAADRNRILKGNGRKIAKNSAGGSIEGGRGGGGGVGPGTGLSAHAGGTDWRRQGSAAAHRTGRGQEGQRGNPGLARQRTSPSTGPTSSRGSANDVIFGLNGNDAIDGGPGPDVILGGPDGGAAPGGPPNSDIMLGGPGNDVNLWAPGDGSEAFLGGPGLDALVFGATDREAGSGSGQRVFGCRPWWPGSGVSAGHPHRGRKWPGEFLHGGAEPVAPVTNTWCGFGVQRAKSS